MGIFGGEGRLIGGRYRLGIRLGRGGMGTVWRATDELLDRQVAVKELHLDEEAAAPEARVQRERAMREARTVAGIKHPHVIVVHDVVEQDGRPWIVMELVEGSSLADRLHSGGPVAPREAARIGVALLGALRAAHTRGVLHRDLKPANVLLESGTGRVVLTDFGIAQVPGATTLTDAGGFVGSPEYTAPERMAGRATGPEADLWSLGVLLCAALHGESPFHRDSLAGVLHAVVYDTIELPEAARPLRAVVGGLLERDPERRLDIAGTERLLSGCLHSGPAPERAPGGHRPPAPGPAPAGPGFHPPAAPGTPVPAARPRTGRTRTALLVALGVVVIAGAGAGGTALLMHQDGTTDDGGRTGRPGHSQQAADATPSRKPGGPHRTAAAGPAPAPTATTPAGYRVVRDTVGFALAVPDGFTRSYEHDRVYYYSQGKRFRIGVQLQQRVPQGPLGAMRTADAKGPATYRGYRQGQVTETTHNGLTAGLWEFVWNGSAQDGGSRYTYDLSWDEGGRMIDVWISSPLGSRTEAKRHFDTAVDAFRLTGT
ncbi:serine/threonine-protein kinase [Streptomyces lydicus]|uniref:non-specific serine/threonine protein kinase n=1 Tax=Streptomyces lydicus TaxID=47763 RepID=A0A1D7VUT4_9ACTN|nr:serine/threonine-protein kinase [Streptomyces lydicus]AOP50248.1 serine/threonine protein kinase [Streptomyces lydicus]